MIGGLSHTKALLDFDNVGEEGGGVRLSAEEFVSGTSGICDNTMHGAGGGSPLRQEVGSESTDDRGGEG